MSKLLLGCVFAAALVPLAAHALTFFDETPAGFSVNQNKLNVNQATVTQLANLKGLGPKKAQAIVEYVKENGSVTTLNQLLAVKGIGLSVLRKIKPYLSVNNKADDLE